MINNVTLTGRLTKDCDLKYTGNGNAVASFTLAVNKSYKRDGEPDADFINCVVWNKTAEALANYTVKGSLIGVTGSIQTRNYENQQGQRVYVTEVLVQKLVFLETQKNGSGDVQTNQQTNTHNDNSNQNWQGNTSQNQKNDPILSSGQTIDISEDDLPF